MYKLLSLKLYVIILYILAFLFPLWLHLRKIKKRENPHRLQERYGITDKKRPEGKLIWFHASSVGECLSIMPLIKMITQKYPMINILLTSGTLTSANIIQKQNHKNLIHQFVPLDHLPYVKRFLKHWQPSLVFFVESELWINHIFQIKKKDIPLILINARLSPSSFKSWKKLKRTIQAILASFNLILTQDNDSYHRFQEINAPNLHITGNLKFDMPLLKYNHDDLLQLQQQINQRPVWIAASTHHNEEEIIFKTHNDVKKEHPNLLTIIIPRHPHRGTQLTQLFRDQNCTIAQRSTKNPITENTDIYIADTIGEMGLFYRLSHISFIGGSLIPHGGQNPLEAGQLQHALMHGPHTHNFKFAYEQLHANKAAYQVEDHHSLTSTLLLLLSDKEKSTQMGIRASHIISKRR